MSQNILGVDLGGSKLLMICGERRARISTDTNFSPADLELSIRTFIDALEQKPQGIGIAIPGLVDSSGEILACDVLPQMEGWLPHKRLADLQCPIAVINDVNAAAIEEFHDAPPGLTAGIIMVGTAIGASFVVDGKPLMGAGGWAGELGYIPLASGGEIKRLDELAGGGAIANQLGVNGADLAALAQAGDDIALQAIQAGGKALGWGLATIINLFNPAKIAIGGGTISLPGYWDNAIETAKDFSLPTLWDYCHLTKVRSGKDVVALGAARSLKI
jgi:predicted NBD/HSP70 family sugar kinase